MTDIENTQHTKHFIYIPDTVYLGERCRLIIILNHVYISFSRDRFRFNFDITF